MFFAVSLSLFSITLQYDTGEKINFRLFNTLSSLSLCFIYMGLLISFTFIDSTRIYAYFFFFAISPQNIELFVVFVSSHCLLLLSYYFIVIIITTHTFFIIYFIILLFICTKHTLSSSFSVYTCVCMCACVSRSPQL